MVSSEVSFITYAYVGINQYEIIFDYNALSSVFVNYYNADGEKNPDGIPLQNTDWEIVMVNAVPYVSILIDLGEAAEYGKIEILRTEPYTQTQSFLLGADIQPKALERALDRMVWQIQQVDKGNRGSLTVPFEDGTTDMTIPDATLRRTKYLAFADTDEAAPVVLDPEDEMFPPVEARRGHIMGFDATAQARPVAISGEITEVPVSPYMAGVLLHNSRNTFLEAEIPIRGHNSIGMSSWYSFSTYDSKVEAGSMIEVDGEIITFSEDTAIDRTGAHTGTIYLLIGSDGIPFYLHIMGTWDPSRQGYYAFYGAHGRSRYTGHVASYDSGAPAIILNKKMFLDKNGGKTIVLPAEDGGSTSGALEFKGAVSFDSPLTPTKGVVPSGVLTGIESENQIFDALQSLVPDVGDLLKVTGGYNHAAGGDLITLSHIKRESNSEIRLYGLSNSSGNSVSFLVTNGNYTSVQISMAW